MHNRLRMITAMFLTRNLFIDWRPGEAYFMSKLVDGFLASNNGAWHETGRETDPRSGQRGVIPKGYPRPIVDLKASRKKAIAKFQELKD